MTIRLADMEEIRIIAMISGAIRDLGLHAYLVGGLLRDALLRRECKDIDVLVMDTDGAGILARHLHTHKGFYPPVLFRTYGTYRTSFAGWDIEIVPPRGRTLEEDLALRDFTVNTLVSKLGEAMDSGSMTAEDRLGTALGDLEKKILKTPIHPEKSLGDDPLRALRAVRLSCSLGFDMDGGLSGAIIKTAASLKDTAVERIRDEVVKILLLNPPSRGTRLMHTLGLLDAVAPEIVPAIGHEQKSPYHHQDVFEHCLTVMDGCEPDIVLRLAGLFHDIGKVEAEAERDGRTVYYGHQKYSVEKVRSFLSRLRFSREIRDAVIFLVENHMVCYTEEWKDSTVKRFMRKMGPQWERLMKLIRADMGALRPDLAALGARDHMTNYENLIARAKALKLEEVQALTSPLNGHEIQEILGVQAGPLIGQIKEEIVSAILDGKIPGTKDAARRWVFTSFVHK